MLELIMKTLLLALLFVATPLHADEKLLPRPTDDEVAKADDEIQSGYGSDVKAAKLSTQKAKLAKEMLEVALKTPGCERLQLCQLARQLAAAGGDKTTAFAASAAIAERFEPEDGITDGDDQFEEGQDLWREAEKVKGEARLQKQAEAAEWYNYARTSVKGLKKKIIGKRLEIEDGAVAPSKEKKVASTFHRQPTIVYLDDVQESEFVVGGSLSKHGQSDELGHKRAHCLAFFPPKDGVARIRYQLDRRYTTFKAMATLDTKPYATAQTFKVFGDGKLLWQSSAMTHPGAEECDIAISKVLVLELQVECPGTANNANVAWVDPCVMAGPRPKPPIENLRRLPDVLPKIDAEPQKVYLDDMRELDSAVGWGKLGKHGETSGELGIAKHAHELVAMPSSNGSWRVSYRIDRRFTAFKALATLEATPHHPVALTFKVFGDNKLLWQSKPLTNGGASEQCNIQFKKVRILELQVECPGSNSNAHTAWVDPCLSE